MKTKDITYGRDDFFRRLLKVDEFLVVNRTRGEPRILRESVFTVISRDKE